MSLIYQPPPTIERFMLSDALVRCVVGPLGSGKSMGCIMELVRRARQQVPDSNGVRRTRVAVIRNTMSQLRQTCLADIQQYLQPMLHFFVTDSTVQIRAPLDDGTVMHSDWLLIPLDTKQDVQRLLSMQLTMAWCNEFREIPFDVVSALIGRLGRFPSRVNGGPTFFGLIMDSNPTDTDSPYYDRLIMNPDPNWALFHQPSGVGPHVENLENLPQGYYDNLVSERDPDWSDVYVRSEWGTSNAGQAVFRRSFDAQTHVQDMLAIVNPMRPIAVAMDFGRTPCALIGQVDSYGRLLVFQEVVTDDIGLHAMVAERLKPILLAEPYIGKRVFVVADPAGRERSQYSEENAFDVLRQAGLLAWPAPTNDIAPRLLAVEKILRQTIMGEPGVQISRIGCPTLVRAMASQYRYRRRRDGQLDDVPEKSHPWSDVADCLQYLCLAVSADMSSKIIAKYRPRQVERKFTAAAWT